MPDSIQPNEPSEPSSPAIVAQALSRVEQQPVKSVSSAFVVGLIVSIIPIGRIISAVASLALAFVRPALMTFGAFKIWEVIDRRGKE